MKRILATLTLSLTALVWLSAQTIFVNPASSGANNGSSWVNAFTTLEAALAVAGPGNQIWVKSGVYKPNTTTTANASFNMLAGVQLYGGFAGNETSLSQRDYVANPTTLSGDILGDDSPSDLTLNRADNSWHVLVVSNGVPAERAVVDGFVIRNGNTKAATADPDLTKRGGGILAVAKLTVRNCSFIENQALTGGAIAALDAVGSGLIVDNCIFDNNLSTSQAAGIFFRTCTSGSLNRCIFKNNNTNRGTVYPNGSSNIVIDSCLFENNKAGTDRWGAGFYNWQSSYTMTNCIFRGNIAHNAGGMYNDNRDGGDFFTIDNCLFEANGATSYGGSAIFNNVASFDIKNCQFVSNTAPTSAASIYIGGTVIPEARILNCSFEGGSTLFGAAISNYGGKGLITIEGCNFKNNNATTSGGAVTNGFKANTLIKNCLFDANNARFGGGVFAQNDSTNVTIEGCVFQGNNGDDVGGGVFMSSGNITNIKNSIFTLNASKSGAGLVISEDSLDLSIANISGCSFTENFALNQGGGINMDNATMTVTNSLFAGNQVLGTGAGAGALVNASNGKTAVLNLINSTMGGNFGPLGAGVAGYENIAQPGSKSIINLQNTILSNDGDNFAIEDGAPTVNSLGGNLSSDGTLSSVLTGTNDLNNTDPLFVNAGLFDLHLQASSPCINKGVATGAPANDITGALRIGAPDMGCYEFGVVGVQNPATQRIALSLTPNPAVDITRSTIENSFHGQLSVQISDASGKIIRSLFFEKTSDTYVLELNIQDLPTGAYMVRVQAGQQLLSGGLVKI
jgi:predicted outer membrane repeat protein